MTVTIKTTMRVDEAIAQVTGVDSVEPRHTHPTMLRTLQTESMEWSDGSTWIRFRRLHGEWSRWGILSQPGVPGDYTLPDELGMLLNPRKDVE